MRKLLLITISVMAGVFTATAQTADAASPHNTPGPIVNNASNALFDLEFIHNIGAEGSIGVNGNAGIIYFNNEYWVSAWQSNLIHVLDSNGGFVETFSIPGVSGVRSMTTDGTNIYIGTAGSQIFEVDPASRTLISTINISSSAAARMCAYDETLDGGNGGFWIGSFGNSIASVSRTGAELSLIPFGTHGTTVYGGAVDNISPGGPYLWIHNQTSAGGADLITQLQLPSGTPTGVEYNFAADGAGAGAVTVLAGGLFISEELVPGEATLVGVSQATPSDLIFAVELVGSLGTADNSLGLFSLYPNPTTEGRVSIVSQNPGDMEVSIFDVLGKKVLQQKLSSRDLDVSALTSGVYMIQITQNEVVATKKLVVK